MSYVSEYYPPIRIEDLSKIFDMSLSDSIKFAKNGTLKTKKIGKNIYVSNKSLEMYKDKIILSKKDRVKRLTKNILKEKYENKILTYANLIKSNRKLSKENKETLKSMKNIEDKCDNLSDLSYESFNEIDFDLNFTYSEIKESIREAKNSNVFGFTKTK